MESPTLTPEYLTVPEVWNVFRINRNLLYVLLNSGFVRGVKLGRRRLFEAASIREYLQTLTVSPTIDEPQGAVATALAQQS